MARPAVARGTKMLIQIGDGGSPVENFIAPCAIQTKGSNRTAAVNEFSVADCQEPDDPFWTERVKGALSADITGSGQLAPESLDMYEAFWKARDARNVRVSLDFPVGVRRYQGAYHMTAFNISGEQDGLIQVEFTLQSSGAVEQL